MLTLVLSGAGALVPILNKAQAPDPCVQNLVHFLQKKNA